MVDREHGVDRAGADRGPRGRDVGLRGRAPAVALAWAGLGAGLGAACGPAEPAIPAVRLARAPARPLGTYEPGGPWPSRPLRWATGRAGLSARRGEVVLLSGAGLVSGAPGDWGLTVEDPDSDVARVVAEAARAGADVPGVLVVFTTFDDHGAGGAGYYLPVFDDTAGTGAPALDVRAAYGAAAVEGVVNLKHPEQPLSVPFAELAAHELAHRHAAHLAVVPSSTTATIASLLGRQASHWHAALHSEASLLDGYAWRDLGDGRFRVEERLARLGSLDLYAAGLLDAAEVPPFFFIAGARTLGGATIPPAAQLGVGTVIAGSRVDLTVDDVVAALGPRARGAGALRAAVVLVTAPDQAIDDAEVLRLADVVEARRAALEAAWSSATRGRGRLCTRLAGCPSEDAGALDAAGVGTDATDADASDALGADRAEDADGGPGAPPRDAGGPDGGEPADEACGCATASRTSFRDLAPTVLALGVLARRRARRGSRARALTPPSRPRRA